MPTLDRVDGRLRVTAANYGKLGAMDRIFRNWVRTEGVGLAEYLIRKTGSLFDLNTEYFRNAVGGSSEAFTQAINATRKEAYLAIGYNVDTGKLINNGPLESIFSDPRPINNLKQVVSQAISTGSPVENALADVTARGNGTTGAGALESHLGERMPDPLLTFDREVQTMGSAKLELNHAIYQGGIIQTTRPFCAIRDNRVFTREEIARFGTSQDQYGGYTGPGEFQGKCPKTGYNPFLHLGGCRCRHQLDWISDELAFRLRPELRDGPRNSQEPFLP